MDKRLNYIDNLRWITVSLLILYHGAMAYNTWGEANYTFFENSSPIASIVVFISPWFMPLMFLLAGVSSYYSLQKRGYAAFLKERALRLGIPLVFGLTTAASILSYIADVAHNGWKGSFFEHYGVFFTRFTDLTGYDGGFTMGHLWFIAVLIVISLLSCVIIKLTGELNEGRKKLAAAILSLIAIAAFEVRPAGKPLITYLFVYLLGYYVFSDRELTRKLSKYFVVYAVLFLIFSVGNVTIFLYVHGYETLNNICNYASFITGILALTSLGQRYLDISNSFTKFNSKISYVFYILHFPIVVLCQYFLSLANIGNIANLVLTLVITYPLTYAICVLIEKTKYMRVLFGMRVKSDK